MLVKKSNSSGFSYIDLMCAIVILMVGILAMVSALMANLVRSYESEKRVVAKQMALSTIESIISAKEIERPGVVDGWLSIRNVISPAPVGEPNGIFLPGWNPVREEQGWDGVAGTIADACADTGPCVVTGRPTNASAIVNGFERQITITDVDDPERPAPNPIMRRRVDVVIRFPVGRATGAVGQTFGTRSSSTIVTDYATER